ncbi:MAG TPA: AAA family ATPase, partial [Acidimicrobiales bacterium]|nr:AAA family ATPase [Acidimicrobiales bacterium]
MRQLWLAYHDHAKRVVVVTGEAGSGKTRLVNEFLAALPAQSVVVVQSFELAGEAFSFPNLEAALGGVEGQRSLAAVGSGAGQYAQFAAWAANAEAHRAGPDRGVLVVEDIHWADRTTLDFLNYLARRPGDVLTILTRRTSAELSAAARFDDLSELVRLPVTLQITVPALTVEESEQLVSSIAASEVAGQRRRELAVRSDGNPYLLIELTEARGVLPDHVAEVLLARTRALGPAEGSLLELIAVAGGSIDDELLEAAYGPGPASYASAVRAVTASGAVSFDKDNYMLRHSLTREAIEQRMSPAQSRACHRSLAAAAERLGRTQGAGEASVRALHWWAAGDRDRAGPAMLQAARDASRLFAHAEAWGYYAKALELLGPGSRQSADLLIEAGETARWAGQLHAAIALLRAALDPQDVGIDRARLLERLGRYLWEAGEPEASVLALDEATSLLESSPAGELTARLEAARARNLLTLGRTAEAAEAAVRASELAQVLALATVVGDAQITLGVAQVLDGDEKGLSTVQAALGPGGSAIDYEVVCRW